ncbi:MAG TPA: efflux RND transporter periplasmic adaptor subunit [Planctomycetota bacterium]|nr:efflux RND transporter periplasmic adaptor subunit [Planctomycetota bacterium]
MKLLPAAIALILLGLASLPFLLASEDQPAQAAGAPPPPVVTVAPVEERELCEYALFTGRVEAVDDVQLRARVSGHLDAVHFQAGQIVHKGDVLFSIDPRWHEAALSATEATVAQAGVRFDNAERESKRATELLASRAISAEESETRNSRLAEARAGVLSAEAARNSAKLDLEFTQVRSPIDGQVGRALVTPGNFVSGVAGSNTVLTTIVSVDPVYVYADVDEDSLLILRRLMREQALKLDAEGRVLVEIGRSDESGYPHVGGIESIGNHLDEGTGSIPLRAIVPNPDGDLVAGMFARMRVPISPTRMTPLVPEQSLGTDQSQRFVLVLAEDNTAQYRAVKLGPAVDTLRIVRDGVRAGELIVVNGLQRVQPGKKVTPQREGEQTESGSASH